MQGCLDDFPLAYLEDFAPAIRHAVDSIELLSTAVKVNNTETVELIGEYCGNDMHSLPTSLQTLSSSIVTLDSSFADLVDATSCHNVSPMVRRLTHGDICTNSAFGLAWVWSCMYALCFCGFIMLSTRAALFSTVITRRNIRENRRYKKGEKKRKLKPSCVVEEFEEYRKFMADYFDDTDQWAMVPIKKLIAGDTLELELGSVLMRPPTFDTEGTSPTSDEGIGFHGGVDTGFYVDSDSENDAGGDNASGTEVDDDVSYYSGSSDESTDGEDDYDPDDDVSALASMMSFSDSVLSDARSLARSAMKAVRALPSMLGINKDESSFEDDNNDMLFSERIPESPYPRQLGLDGHTAMLRTTRLNASDEDDPWNTPPNQIIPMYPNSTVHRGRSLVPNAPQKLIRFLGRAEESELEPLTPSRTIHSPSNRQSSLEPRQLEMSPLLSPEKRASGNARIRLPRNKIKRSATGRGSVNPVATSRQRNQAKSDTSWIRKSPLGGAKK